MTWQQAIKQAIESIPYSSYDNSPSEFGVSEDIYWNGELIMEASDPTRSNCVGACGEAILKAFKLLGLESVIPAEDIHYFRKYGFILEEDYFDGYAGALIDLDWGYWVDEEDTEYGDLAQYWHENDDEQRTKGHAIIITGRGKYKGLPVFKDWSATNLASINGHGYDWHLVDKELKTGHYRVWYIARPDIAMIRNKYS
jgi:hypothetical protein